MRFVTEFFRDLRTSLYRNATLMANTVVARFYTPYAMGLAATIVAVVAFLGMLSRF